MWVFITNDTQIHNPPRILDGETSSSSENIIANCSFIITIKTASYPAGRLYQNLASGKIDLFLGITPDKMIQGTTIISKQPIGYPEMRAYRLGKKISVYEKIFWGKHTILISGFSYNGWTTYLQSAVQNGKATICVHSTHQ